MIRNGVRKVFERRVGGLMVSFVGDEVGRAHLLHSRFLYVMPFFVSSLCLLERYVRSRL